MLGAALLSDSNEILHVFGNALFHKRMRKDTEMSYANRRSTSGISTSSSINSLLMHVEDRATGGGDNMDKGHSLVNADITVASTRNAAHFTETSEIDERALAEKLLPLVLLHRTRKELESNELYNIESETLRLESVELSHSHLLILMTDESLSDEKAAKQFLDCTLRCLAFHYGQSVNLVQTGSSGMARVRSRVNRRMRILAQKFDRPSIANEIFNLNLTFGSSHELQKLAPHLKELALRTSLSLGRRCRCFFVNSGSLIASVQCSPPSERSLSTFDVMEVKDIGSLLEFTLLPADSYPRQLEGAVGASAAKKCLKCQVEQAWIFSKILNRRQLLNVFVLSISGEMELICLANADHAALVTAICELIEGVGKQRNAGGFHQELKRPRDEGACCRSQQDERMIKRVLASLATFRTSLPFDSYLFLSNLERTQKLLRSHWNRLKNALSENSTTLRAASVSSSIYSMDTLRSQLRQSVSRLGSSLSVFSNASSQQQQHHLHRVHQPLFHSIVMRNAASTAPSATSTWHSNTAPSGRVLSAVHLEAMKSQFLHLLRSLLCEVLAHSYATARTQLLERLHTVVRATVGREMSEAMEVFLERAVRMWSEENPMRPASLGFDMLAYKFHINELDTFNLHCIPERYRAVFSQIEEQRSSPPSSRIERIGKTSDGYLVVQLRTELGGDGEKSRRLRLRYADKKKTVEANGKLDFARSGDCTALFPDYVHVKLAVKQTRELSTLLVREMKSALRNLK